jgi:hypothetical protein
MLYGVREGGSVLCDARWNRGFGRTRARKLHSFGVAVWLNVCLCFTAFSLQYS